MSLAALAVRVATLRAIKGRTFAGANVYDSTINPLNLVLEHSGKDFVVVVMTDDDSVTIEGRDLFAGDHRMELIIVVAATAEMVVRTDDGEVERDVVIAATDAGLEAQLNILGWQIMRALQAGGGEWGDLWRTIVLRVNNVSCYRGGDESNGIRYAARQYVFQIDTIAEPEPGTALSGVWGRIIEMLRDDDEYDAVADVIDAVVTDGPMPPWERIRASLGLARDASEHFSEWPLEPEEVSKVNEIAMTDGFVLNASTAEDADGPETD
jgi:hypothetical protein